MKLLTTYLHRKKFYVLLNKMEERFWNSDAYQPQVHEEMEITQLTRSCWWFCLYYAVGGSILSIALVIKPALFNSGRQVPLMCWAPEGNPTPFYQTVYLIEAYILLNVVFIVGGFDIFYTSLNIRICVQFKLLRYELEHVIGKEEKKNEFRLKRCIKHHQLLLELVFVLNNSNIITALF